MTMTMIIGEAIDGRTEKAIRTGIDIMTVGTAHHEGIEALPRTVAARESGEMTTTVIERTTRSVRGMTDMIVRSAKIEMARNPRILGGAEGKKFIDSIPVSSSVHLTGCNIYYYEYAQEHDIPSELHQAQDNSAILYSWRSIKVMCWHSILHLIG